MRRTHRTLVGALVVIASTIAGPASPVTHAASPALFATSIDTMKESRDTETRPLTDAQIADDVNLAARMNTNYITVDTHWDYPGYMRRWVDAIRATGRHVWFRIHPNQWENDNGTTGIMTPAQYEASEQAFIDANATLFQPGDILDPCPEPENGLYWIATYGNGWTSNAPNPATQEYNAFMRATSDLADAALQQNGISGVITTVRSTNSFFATHPGALEQETVARMGRVTVDSYPEGSTTDPATAAAARVGELNAIEQSWGVPVVIGEMGYSNEVPVDDATQNAVLAAEQSALAALPYLVGINYWVGAGTDNSGGYTHLYSGSTGDWALRPAGATTALFYGAQASAANLDVARFNWEDGATQGWFGRGAVTGLAASTVEAYRGGSSLAITFSAIGAINVAVTRTLAGIAAGTPLQMHLYVPSGTAINAPRIYTVDATGATAFSPPLAVTPGAWSTLAYTIPAQADAPLRAIGLYAPSSGTAGTIYLDSVDDGTYAVDSAARPLSGHLSPHARSASSSPVRPTAPRRAPPRRLPRHHAPSLR